MPPTATVWTLGHSNTDTATFLALVHANGIERVVDVRRFPSSRRHPHFSREPLRAALLGAGVAYAHAEALGGQRTPRPGSRHTALAEPFRGYADHMETPAFEAALARLIDLARERPTAVLCAERDWRHCHRSLLSDRLVVAGCRVLHARPDAAAEEHLTGPSARVVEGRLVYAAPEQLELF